MPGRMSHNVLFLVAALSLLASACGETGVDRSATPLPSAVASAPKALGVDPANGGAGVVDEGTLALGARHTCAILPDNSLSCWGDNTYAQSAAPSGHFRAISAGAKHTCGIKTNGEITCWGDNSLGQTASPPGVYLAIESGSDNTCALRVDSTISCWGDVGTGISTPPFGTFSKISVGATHACALDMAGKLTCWGSSSYGEPNPPYPNLSYTAISAGSHFTCGLSSTSMLCWGLNDFGQSAYPSVNNVLFASVATGSSHTCATKIDGSALCFGKNTSGQVSVAPGVFKRIYAGDNHSCGVDVNGALSCWGANDAGQSSVPAAAMTIGRRQLSAGQNHVCMLRPDRSIKCWGANTANQATPPAGNDFQALSVGSAHSCAIKGDSTLACWGSNSAGQVSPLPNNQGTVYGNYTALSAGALHSCAIRGTGFIDCWGSNADNRASAPGGSGYLAIDSGDAHSCALGPIRTITCWGANTNGQTTPPVGTFVELSLGARFSCALGVNHNAMCWGDNTDNQVSAAEGPFFALSAGAAHACAIRLDGSLACWGANDNGQATPPAGEFVAVEAGDSFTCGVKADGTYTCWGNNASAQAPRLTLASLSAALYQTPFDESLSASGGTAPYTYSTMSVLPTGMTLSAAGLFSGTPTLAGTFPLVIHVQDANALSLDKAIVFTVACPPEQAGNDCHAVVCGDSMIEGTEQCEKNGGVFADCCDPLTCHFKTVGSDCGTRTDSCEIQDTCDNAGRCQDNGSLPDLDLCDDSDPCTIGDSCVSGICVSGAPKDCADTADCTQDSCNSGDGSCEHAPVHTACSDSNDCTADVCEGETGCTHESLTDWAACGDTGMACFTGACEALSVNDTCAGAKPLLVDILQNVEIAGYHASRPLPPACTGKAASGRDAFYSFVTEAGKTYKLSVTPLGGVDIAVALWKTCAVSDACLGGADAQTAGAAETLDFGTGAEAGTLVIEVVVVADARKDGEAGFTILAEEKTDADGDADSEIVDADTEPKVDGDEDSVVDGDTEADTDTIAETDIESIADGDTDNDMDSSTEPKSSSSGGCHSSSAPIGGLLALLGLALVARRRFSQD